jgi:hypothetical protein
MLYLVYGVENYNYDWRGKSKGTPHFQGCVSFKKPVDFKHVKSILPRAHWESVRTTLRNAADYCKKDGIFTEYGDYTAAENLQKPPKVPPTPITKYIVSAQMKSLYAESRLISAEIAKLNERLLALGDLLVEEPYLNGFEP